MDLQALPHLRLLRCCVSKLGEQTPEILVAAPPGMGTKDQTALSFLASTPVLPDCGWAPGKDNLICSLKCIDWTLICAMPPGTRNSASRSKTHT